MFEKVYGKLLAFYARSKPTLEQKAELEALKTLWKSGSPFQKCVKLQMDYLLLLNQYRPDLPLNPTIMDLFSSQKLLLDPMDITKENQLQFYKALHLAILKISVDHPEESHA